VTFNAADFPFEAIEEYGLDIMHPDEFMIAIDDGDPGTLIDAGRQDMAHYKNPALTLEEYLDGLRAGGVPMTADRLARLHGSLGG